MISSTPAIDYTERVTVMCMKATDEGCVLKEQLKTVQGAIEDHSARLTQVEHDVAQMRSEAQNGFSVINSAVNSLAQEFGVRMNNLDRRFIEEKERWGQTLRTLLTWGAKALILGSLVAMGVSTWRSFAG